MALARERGEGRGVGGGRPVGRRRATSSAALGHVVVRGLRVQGRHGVLPEEHTHLQRFLIDLDLQVDLRRAAACDRLQDTVDYAEAARLSAEVVLGPHRDLIEALAGEIAARLLEAFPQVRGGVVVVHKPDAPIGRPVADVSVHLPFRRPHAGGWR